MSHPVIFREYICVKPYPKSFKFPNIDDKKIDFHVILGFAHEHLDKNGKRNGNFYDDWDLDICGIKSAKEIKDKYPNVKVIISIGGRDAEHPFNPIEKEKWCDNAVNSLTTIIQQNNVDGIDINYELIMTNENDFSDYVGDVIKKLKEDEVIDVVSIAPSHVNDKNYKQLYSDIPDYIDWVDYQFYMKPIRTVPEFLNLFWSLTREYDPNKLLVGASTDLLRDEGNVPLDVFVNTCTHLIKDKALSGIFIWNANDLEKIALDILGNN